MKGFSAVSTVANGKQQVNVRNLFASLAKNMVFLIRIVEAVALHQSR